MCKFILKVMKKKKAIIEVLPLYAIKPSVSVCRLEALLLYIEQTHEPVTQKPQNGVVSLFLIRSWNFSKKSKWSRANLSSSKLYPFSFDFSRLLLGSGDLRSPMWWYDDFLIGFGIESVWDLGNGEELSYLRRWIDVLMDFWILGSFGAASSTVRFCWSMSLSPCARCGPWWSSRFFSFINSFTVGCCCCCLLLWDVFTQLCCSSSICRWVFSFFGLFRL